MCNNFFERQAAYSDNYNNWRQARNSVPSEASIEQAKTIVATGKDVQQVKQAMAWLKWAEEEKQNYEWYGKRLEAEKKLLDYCDNNCPVRETLPSRDMPGAPVGADLDKSDSFKAGKPTLPSPPPINSPCAGKETGVHCQNPP